MPTGNTERRAQDVGLELIGDYVSQLHETLCRCLVCGKEELVKLAGRRGYGCKACSYKAGASSRALSEKSALARLASKCLSAREPYPGTTQVPWAVSCNVCGHDSAIRISQKGRSCPSCASKKKAAARRITHAQAAKKIGALGFSPLEAFPGPTGPWRARCMECSTAQNVYWKDVKHKSFWCSFCHGGNRGRSGNPGSVYLVWHPKRRALKVGVASTPNLRCRLADHRRNGWAEVFSTDVSSMAVARRTEARVLRFWRETCDAPPALKAASMPQSGWTETVSTSRVPVKRALRQFRRSVTVENT